MRVNAYSRRSNPFGCLPGVAGEVFKAALPQSSIMQVEMIEAARPTYHESRRDVTDMRACDVQRACATSSQVMMIYCVQFDELNVCLFRFTW